MDEDIHPLIDQRDCGDGFAVEQIRPAFASIPHSAERCKRKGVINNGKQCR